MISGLLLLGSLYSASATGMLTFDDFTATWDISGGAVTFTVSVNDSNISGYDWWGIGLNPSSSKMTGADIWVIEDGTVTDRIGVANDYPPLDTDNNGTNSLYYIAHSMVSTTHVYTFTRDLLTGDASDVDLVEGSTYTFIWAKGKSSSTDILEHKSGDYGDVDITLSNNYVGDDSSSSSYIMTGVVSLVCAALQ
jgi:hypothetical protein